MEYVTLTGNLKRRWQFAKHFFQQAQEPKFWLDVNKFAKSITKELREMVKAIKTVFQDTPPELSADIIQKGIIMTGGSSQLRNLPELIYRRTGVKALLAKDSLFCVAKGTGVALQHIDIYKRSVISKYR